MKDEKFKSYIMNVMENGEDSRYSVLIKVAASEFGLKFNNRSFGQFMNIHFPQFAISTNKVFKYHRFRRVVPLSLGVVYSDLMYIGHRNRLLTEVGANQKIDTILLAVCTLSRRLFLQRVRGKDASSLKTGWVHICKRYLESSGAPIYQIMFDKERAMGSSTLLEFLNSRGIQIKFLYKKTQKAALAECYVKIVRTIIDKMKAANPESTSAISTLIKKIEYSHNYKNKLIMYGISYTVTPSDITIDTVDSFLKTVIEKDPISLFLRYDLYPGFGKYSMRIGQHVRIKTQALEAQSVFKKKSVMQLTKKKYEILHRFIYLDGKSKIITPAYLLQWNNNETITLPESALVLTE